MRDVLVDSTRIPALRQLQIAIRKEIWMCGVVAARFPSQPWGLDSRGNSILKFIRATKNMHR